MDIVSRILTRSNLEWASLFVGFAIIWMVSGFFVKEPSPPALIEKKDPVVRVIDQKAENYSIGRDRPDKNLTSNYLLIYILVKSHQ